MEVRLSALRAGHLLPLGRFLVLFYVRRWVDPRAIVRLEGLGQLKNLVTSSAIEPRPSTCSIISQPNALRRPPIVCCTESVNWYRCITKFDMGNILSGISDFELYWSLVESGMFSMYEWTFHISHKPSDKFCRDLIWGSVRKHWWVIRPPDILIDDIFWFSWGHKQNFSGFW
jgi:hypothetical protein